MRLRCAIALFSLVLLAIPAPAFADFPNRVPITFTATNVSLDPSTNRATFNVNPADFSGFPTTDIDVRLTNVALDSGWYVNSIDATGCLMTGTCEFTNLQQFEFPPGETSIGGAYQIGFFPASDSGQVRWSQVINAPLPPHFWAPINFTTTNIVLDAATRSATFNLSPSDFTGFPTTNIDVRFTNSEFDSGWYANNQDVGPCLTTGSCSFPNLQQYLLPPGSPLAGSLFQIGFFPDGDFGSARWSQTISTSDSIPPTITISTPTPDIGYTQNQIVNASYFCSDELGGSGVASCVGSVDGHVVASGDRVPMTPGAHTLTVVASDNSGNTDIAHRQYLVWAGFSGPANSPPTVNIINAGASVPFVFSLSGYQGLAIFDTGYPKSQAVDCQNWTSNPTGPVESTTSTPAGLTYDQATDQYTYVWKTDKTWAATCRQIVLRFASALPNYGGGQVTFDLKFK